MKAPSAWLLLAALAPVAAGCAATPPPGPSVVVLPPQGKDLTQFQREDVSCRQYAAARIASESPPQTKGVSTDQLQRDYDIAYAQCMAATGNQLSPYSMSFEPFYNYPYPPFYDDWWGPGFGVGFVSFAGPRFHHRGFNHMMGSAHGHPSGHTGGHSGGNSSGHSGGQRG
jgi:hypothetical protein